MGGACLFSPDFLQAFLKKFSFTVSTEMTDGKRAGGLAGRIL